MKNSSVCIQQSYFPCVQVSIKDRQRKQLVCAACKKHMSNIKTAKSHIETKEHKIKLKVRSIVYNCIQICTRTIVPVKTQGGIKAPTHACYYLYTFLLVQARCVYFPVFTNA